jgi:hypothetical protein
MCPMTESEQEDLIRRYATGEMTWQLLRERGFDNSLDVLGVHALFRVKRSNWRISLVGAQRSSRFRFIPRSIPRYLGTEAQARLCE